MKHGAESRAETQRHMRWLWWLIPVLLWFGSGALRIHLTLSDPEFDALSADGLLKSDPGLLFYLTERVIGSGGGTPDDWRGDRHIEHPDPIDIPATFTVGQEFLIARAYAAFGAGMPLHVFCVWLMSFVASMAVLGVFGAVRGLTGSHTWASIAALLYALTPANYRTVGFILMREDLSLPLYSLHLWAFACAARCHGASRGPGPLAPAVALLTLAGALATWHGMGFLVAIEGLVLVAAFALTGANPFLPRAGRAAFLVLPLMVVLVPAMRAKALGAPPWMLLAAILWACAWLPERFRLSRGARLASVTALTASIAGAATLRSGGDLSHVTGLLASKLRHLGRFPDDPSTLPFDVRLLWQGPFETSALVSLWRSLLALPVLLALGLARGRGARRQPGSHSGRALGAFTVLSLVAGWLVARTLVLTGLLAPICVAVACRRPQGPLQRRLVMALVTAQVVLFGLWAREFELAWYRPALRQTEIATMVGALDQLVPPGEAIAADFMNSTAILAHTGHPIVLQPKWESVRSRERVELFWHAFYHGSPDELRTLLRDEFDCRYLLVDRFTLWILRASRRVAGLGAEQHVPLPGSAAESLLDPDTDTEGFELVWRSPQTILQSNGRPSDFFRLYHLVD